MPTGQISDPCIDCRWCFDHAGCAVKDEWQEVLSYIEECDHIIMASPVYFEEVTGMLLAVMSRLQTYFSARYIRKEEPVPKKKTGAVLLTAGSIGPREKAESTAEMLLRQMSCEQSGDCICESYRQSTGQRQSRYHTGNKRSGRQIENSRINII